MHFQNPNGFNESAQDSQLKGESYFLLFQRAKTALRAISVLRLAESFAARALPPFWPPSFPKATAAGFFFLPVEFIERLGMK